MTDREKVIKQIEVDIERANRTGEMLVHVGRKTAKDALALLKEQEDLGTALTNAIELIHKKSERIEKMLKEQEAVEPEVEVLNEIDRLYRCPRCHKHFFYEKQKYCDQCGQAVKWE